jgi:hypothetical protein
MRPDDTCPDGAVRIPLRARNGAVHAYAIVDADAATWANQWRWQLATNGYAKRHLPRGTGPRSIISLHRAIMGLSPGDGLEVDHINRDRLDNRRTNLRVTTRAKNAQNRPSQAGSSRFRGVTWNKACRKWQASLSVNRKAVYLGLFEDEGAAGAAAQAARARLMPWATD